MAEKIHSPAADRPLMMLRFRIGQESGEIWKRTFAQLKKYPDCCDEVWFSTGLSVVPLDTHRKLSAAMAENAKQLRRIGIIPSLQFQSTIGHSDNISAPYDNSGKTWGGYVGRFGKQCKYMNCPRQAGFLRYVNEMARIYGAWHPASIWIDDDLRLNNHSPASEPGGCHCKDCMKAFSQLTGRKFTRKTLLQACKNDPDLQKKWDEFALDSLRGVAHAIAAGLKEVSPGTQLCLQHNSSMDRVDLFHIFQSETGLRSGSRPGAGAYSDHAPFAFLEKAVEMASMKALQPGYDVLSQVCAEIEDCPRVFSSKTAAGLRVETLYYLATGMDSISYFIMDPRLETPEWYGKELLAPLAADAPCYDAFAEHNAGSEPGGVGFAAEAFGPSGLLTIGIPAALYSPYANCKAISAESIKKLPEDPLRKLLTEHSILLDGAAARAVADRGLESLIGGVVAEPASRALMEMLTDDPFNDGIEVRIHHGDHYLLTVPEKLKRATVAGRLTDLNGNDHGISTLLFTRKNGTRVALTGCSAFATEHVSSGSLQFLYRIVDFLSGGALPALPSEPVQCSIVPRVLKDGTLRSVTVLNTVIMTQRPFRLLLRGVPDRVKTAVWWSPSETPVPLKIRRENGVCSVTLPAIAPWQIGWLKIG